MDKNKTIEASTREDTFSTENLGGYAKDTAVSALGGAAGGAVAGAGVGAIPGAVAGGIAGFGNRLFSDVWYHTRSNKDRIAWQAGDLEEKLGKIASVVQKTSPELAQYLTVYGQQYKQLIDYYIRDENTIPMKENNVFDPYQKAQPVQPQTPQQMPQQMPKPVEPPTAQIPVAATPLASNNDMRKVIASIEESIESLEDNKNYIDADRLDIYLNILAKGYQHNFKTAKIKDIAEEGMMIRAAQVIDAYQNIQNTIVQYIQSSLQSGQQVNVDQLAANITRYKMNNNIPTNFGQEKMQTIETLRQLSNVKGPNKLMEIGKALQPWQMDSKDILATGEKLGITSPAAAAAEETAKKGLLNGGIKQMLNPKMLWQGAKGGVVGMGATMAGNYLWDKAGTAIMGGDSYVLNSAINDSYDILMAINKLSAEFKPEQQQTIFGAAEKIVNLLQTITQQMGAPAPQMQPQN